MEDEQIGLLIRQPSAILHDMRIDRYQPDSVQGKERTVMLREKFPSRKFEVVNAGNVAKPTPAILSETSTTTRSQNRRGEHQPQSAESIGVVSQVLPRQGCLAPLRHHSAPEPEYSTFTSPPRCPSSL
jgi:hypothetical protein